MSSTPFYIKKDDTSPSLLVSLTPSNVDITGATGVVFNMRQRGSVTAKISRAAAVLVAPSGPAQLRYDWQTGNTDTEGEFEGEFEVTRSDGTIETWPNDSNLIVIITSDIA